MKNTINSEAASDYGVPRDEAGRFASRQEVEVGSENKIIGQALHILGKRLHRDDVLTSPKQTSDYLCLRYGQEPHEIFGMILVDNRNQVLGVSEMFRGTIDGASVYPREVVKEVLNYNAAGVILFHNHPSGVCEPSQADIRITERLKKALDMIDVRILDHVIVGGATTTSMAEQGLV